MKYSDARTLTTEGVSIHLSGQGLACDNPLCQGGPDVDDSLPVFGRKELANTEVVHRRAVLHNNILSSIVDRYEQLLTAIELSVTDIERKSIYRPSKKMLEYLDHLSRQIIILRWHFWHIRDVINFLTHVHEDRQDIKYLKIVYDDINQLIELVESYQDTVNSNRELYIANVSLQMSDTVKTLTIFSAILLPLRFISSVYGMNGLDLNNIWSIPVGFAILIIVVTMGAVAAACSCSSRKSRDNSGR